MQSEALFPEPCPAGAVGGRRGAPRLQARGPPAAGSGPPAPIRCRSAGCGRSSGPSAARGEEAATVPPFLKHSNSASQHPKSSTSAPPKLSPNWHLSAWEGAGGCGRPCRAKPQQSSPSCRERMGSRPAPGAPGPRGGARRAGCAAGGGAPGSAGATAPPAAGALPEQRRSATRLCARPAVLPPLRPAFSGRSSLPPGPSAAAPAAAPPLPPPPALCPLTFPSPDPRRRAARQLRGPLHAAGRGRGCTLHPIPAPPARCGENGTMPGAGDRGAVRARWLGTGLLGKAAPAWSLPLTLSPSVPQRRGYLEEQCIGSGGLCSAAPSEHRCHGLLAGHPARTAVLPGDRASLAPLAPQPDD